MLGAGCSQQYKLRALQIAARRLPSRLGEMATIVNLAQT